MNGWRKILRGAALVSAVTLAQTPPTSAADSQPSHSHEAATVQTHDGAAVPPGGVGPGHPPQNNRDEPRPSPGTSASSGSSTHATGTATGSTAETMHRGSPPHGTVIDRPTPPIEHGKKKHGKKKLPPKERPGWDRQ